MRGRSGNGGTKFDIGQVDMGGWVRVFLKAGHPPRDFAVYLSQTLTNWFRTRPAFRLKCVVPINRDGDTLELHAWYEAHIFNATDQAPQSTSTSAH
jgi:hypothetical protein